MSSARIPNTNKGKAKWLFIKLSSIEKPLPRPTFYDNVQKQQKMKFTINNLISKHDPLKKWSGVLDFTNNRRFGKAHRPELVEGSVVAVENARPRG